MDGAPRRRYWLWLIWSTYVGVPWMLGVLDMSQWECSPIWAFRHFLASMGYWAAGAALYVLTANDETDAKTRVSMAGRAFAVLVAISAYLALQAVYQCP